MPVISDHNYDSNNMDFNLNEDHYRELLRQLHHRRLTIYEGGGDAAIVKHKQKGKLTARERIQLLVDDRDDFLEIGLFAGYEMYEEYGGAPAAGVVTGIGRIAGRICVIVANDATVKAGAWFPMSGKKNLRAQEIAIENRLPIVYLVDSAGVFLPLQDEIFPDKEHFGRIFRNNAVMSSKGITQIAAIMGPCVAGGAYLPILSDEALIVEGSGSVFLAGPYLVKSAIGEEVDAETLGGADTHATLSGVVDHKVPDDKRCLEKIRSIISKLGETPKVGYNRIKPIEPASDPKELMGIIPRDRTKPYDMMDIIDRIVDENSFDSFKEGYGQTLICGYARIAGWSVGIVANQRKVLRSAKGEMQLGGVIYSDSADKAARFVMNCNQKRIPLIFLQDVTGFMVGSRAEHGGIIKDGAKLVNAVSNSVVPKFTFILGNSYGAGNYAMCGKAYDPRLIFAWPSAAIAVMGGQQAAKTLLQIQVASRKKKGETIDEETEASLLQKIIDQYHAQMSPYYAAARLWIDDIIDPTQTRAIVALGIEMANEQGKIPAFNPGVMQT